MCVEAIASTRPFCIPLGSQLPYHIADTHSQRLHEYKGAQQLTQAVAPRAETCS